MSTSTPSSPSRPPSSGAGEKQRISMLSTLPATHQVPSAGHGDDQPQLSVQVPAGSDTPPFPTSPRLDPTSPRNFSTISSLAGSRELGRAVLEPTTRISTSSPSFSATKGTPVSSPLQTAATDDSVVPDTDEEGSSSVAFHAEPQGLMQMLSLVGSTLFEADRDGFTEDETVDTALAQPDYTAVRGPPADPPLSAEKGYGERGIEEPEAQDFDPASRGTVQGRLRARLRDDGSDDGSTPQGGSSPLDASVLTIGPGKPKRHSLTQSDIIGVARDQTVTRNARRSSNLRTQLHNAALTSSLVSSSRVGEWRSSKDAADLCHAISSPTGYDSTDTHNTTMKHEGSSFQLLSAPRLSPENNSDPLLIRPYSHSYEDGGDGSVAADLDRQRLLQQLKEVFQLEAAEVLHMAQPCWLFRSLLLQGHLYLTSGHVCFYAYLPSRDEKTVKTGMLGKRTRRTHRFSKHFASLKGGKLSWFDSDRDPYFPQGHIDLRKVSTIEPSQNNKDRFKVVTPARRFTFLAEDEQGRDAWVAALRKETFRAQNEGESVRISIPLETVMSVETTISADGTETICVAVVDEAGDFSVDEYYFLHLSKPSSFVSALRSLLDSVGQGSIASIHSGEPALNLSRLSIRDSTGAAHASTTCRKSLEEVSMLHEVHVPVKDAASDPAAISIMSSHSAPGTTSHEQELEAENKRDAIRMGSVTGTAPVAVPVSARRKSKEDSGDTVLSTTPRAAVLNRLSMESSHTYPPFPSISDPPSDFDQVQKEAERGWAIPDWLKSAPSKVLGRAADASVASSSRSKGGASTSRSNKLQRRRKVLEKWSPDREDEAGRACSSTDTEDDLLSHSIHSTQSSYSMLEADEDEEVQRDHSEIAAEFRDTFGIAGDEGLISHTHAYLYRVLPVAGRFFVSEDHLAFRSSGIAAKTVGRTLMLVPLQDVISATKNMAFRPAHHGMVINIRGHEELFIEISSIHRRDELLSLIEHQLELVRGGRGSRSSLEAVTRERSNALVLRDLSERINDEPATLSTASSADSSMLSQQGSELDKSGSVSQLGEGSSLLSFAPTAPLTFTMLTIGSRGDVQPYIALAKGLQADGHRIRIATHAEFGDWIMGHGIEFSEIGGDPAELMRICVENGTFTVSFLKEGVTKFRDWLDDLLASAWRACQGSDVIVECPSAIAGIHVAEALQVPYYRAFTMPWTRTRAYPHAFAVPNKKAGGNYNYMSYVIFDQMFWRASSFQINRWRKNMLGLRPTNFDKLEQHKVPFVYNFSPSLVPRPLDWFEWIHVTGFWFLDNPDNSSSKKWEPPQDLVAFIRRARENKRKLVYIGWGSIVVPDAEAMTRCVLQAVKKSGVCAILSKGWSDRLSADPKRRTTAVDPTLVEDVFQVTSVPHDWLFPQIDAACHHGGAGTLGASLRAGLPTVVKPYFGDQFFWGQQIESLGVGSCVRQLTADNLAAALTMATTNTKQIQRASKLGEQIRSEDGIGNAIKAIYRDLDYARSRVKRDTRIITGSLPPSFEAGFTMPGNKAGESMEHDQLASKTASEPLVKSTSADSNVTSESSDEGHSSDDWSDIGDGPLSPSANSREDPSASLVLGEA